MKVYIVYGAPASGKTTYVMKHKNPNDLIVDFDLIKQSISMNQKTESCGTLYDVAERIRELLLSIIEHRECECEAAWVIAGLPVASERNALAKRLGAELVYMRASERTCIARAMADPERNDKELQLKIIRKWFDRYTEHAFINDERW